MLAPMLSSVTEVKALLAMMNRTVAMTDATVVKRAARKVKKPTASAAHLEKTASGLRNIMTKLKQAPERKRPNIQCETVRIRSRMSVTWAGRETVGRC